MIINFIDEPTVQQRGIVATHVIVQSPTNEYIAELPAIPDENKIQRFVSIEEGDSEICQQIGEALLERWGRKQASIIGEIELNVLTLFKEGIEVDINIANISGVYPLQKKIHNIGTQTTTLILGDIIMDDDELIARMFEEFQG